MKSNTNKESGGILKSIFAAHLILVLHVALIAGVGCLILFFGAIVRYMVWILVIGSLLIFLLGYLIRRRMIIEGKQLKDMLALPEFSGRTIEVSLFGGMASLRLESPNPPVQTLNMGLPNQETRLLDSESHQLRELSELVELLNKNLITLDEYHKFKHKLMGS
jgi:hypothetical protein